MVVPRLLVVLAHPDDEVLALGGRMEWLGSARFITVTDGVPLDGRDARDHGFGTLAEYGAARRGELAAALRMAGLDERCASTLMLADGGGVADQRAAFALVPMVRALMALLDEFRPEAVLTHPYEGGHPDHDACAFAVHAAVQRCSRKTEILEAPFYHARADGKHGMETGTFLPGEDGVVVALSEQQARQKRERLACFSSQARTLQSFGTDVERYRPAPAYDFAQRPHAGLLHYEQYEWGMTGDRFCALAADAMRELRCG